MRKAVALCLLVVLVVAALTLPAAAGRKKKKVPPPPPPQPVKVERVAEGSYHAPTLVAVGTCAEEAAVGCVSIPSYPEETYVKATVTDAHGQPVFVTIKADANGDAVDDVVYGTFCGSIRQPLKIDPGIVLHFWVGLAADPATTPRMAGCVPGLATQGKISATFSNMP